MSQTALSDFDAPTTTTNPLPLDYTDITTHDELLEWCAAYAKQAITNYEMDVDPTHITGWEVSTKAKRRAASFKHTGRLKKAFSPRIGIPFDWETAREQLPETRLGDPKNGHISVTWDAFKNMDEEEWKKTIRHELIHAEQFQAYAKSTHGADFKRKADEYDASLHCEKFADYNYKLYCTECGAMVTGRYKRSKTVKQPERYQSQCCKAPLRSEEV